MNDSYKVFFGLFLKDRSRDKIEKILRENNILLELDKNLHLTVLLDTETYIDRDIDKKYSDEFRNSSIITKDIEILEYNYNRYLVLTVKDNRIIELRKYLEELGYRNYYKSENPIYHVTIKSLLGTDFNLDKKFDCLRNLELEVEELRQERAISYSISS